MSFSLIVERLEEVNVGVQTLAGGMIQWESDRNMKVMQAHMHRGGRSVFYEYVKRFKSFELHMQRPLGRAENKSKRLSTAASSAVGVGSPQNRSPQLMAL